MAFYDYSNYYQHHQPDHCEDDFSYNFSDDYASDQTFSSSYSNISSHKSLEDQLFGYDHQPNDIENALSYTSSYSYAGFSSNQQPVTSYPAHSFNEDNRSFGGYGYNHPPAYHHQHHAYYSYTPIQPIVSYAASPFYESKSFELDPHHINPHDPYKTQFVVSYSTVEFNEPEFEEYDPTPYSGGYDPSSTYGKPLPPSDEICYPKDTAKDEAKVQQMVPIAVPEKTLAAGQGKGIDLQEERPTPKHEEPKPLVLVPEVQKEEDQGSRTYSPLPDVSVSGNDRMFPPAPPGMGLDALDLCESLFGYWPCLARDARRGHCCSGGYDHGGRCIQRINEWEGAANYLFGSPNPYYGTSITSSPSVFAHQYEDQEAQYRQAEYDQVPWIDKLKM